MVHTLVHYLGDRHTYIPWYSIAVLFTQSSYTHATLYRPQNVNWVCFQFEFREAAGNKLEG